MDDPQILRTLRSIEALLTQSMASVQKDVASERTAKTQQATRNRVKKPEDKQKPAANKPMRELTERVVLASARFAVLADEAEKLATATTTARKEMFNLASDVSSTRQNIFAFSTAAKGIADSVATLKFDEQNQNISEQDGLMGTLGQSTQVASSELNTLTGTSKRLNSAFEKVIGTVLKSSAVTVEADAVKTDAVEGSTEAIDVDTDATKRHAEETKKSGGIVNNILRFFGIKTKETADRTEQLGQGLENLRFALGNAAIDIVKDIYYLQSKGIAGFSGSLIELYGNAMKAGMSLQEYTAMMEENAAAVVRFGSFQEFGDSIDRTTRQLNRLGVFGPAAEQLAASMKTNAVALGVPMAQQEGMIAGQVKVFEQLRKTTLMTADGFRELVSDISDNQQVQEQLLGLAPQERAARMQQIVQSATIGQQLGATAKASKSLTDAILAQRGATVKDRFKAAGSIRMGGAILGMDTSRVEEYARIMMKNPAARTKEETVRMQSLAGDYKQFLERLKNNPNPALENIADELKAFEPEVQSSIQNAAAAVKQQTEAGAAINSETGQTASGVMQDIGRGLTALSGFMKNPLADAMVIFGGILAQSIVQGTLLAIIAKNTGSSGGVFDMFSRNSGANKTKRPNPADFVGPNKPGAVSNPRAFLKLQAAQSPVLSAVKSIGPALTGAGKSIFGFVGGIRNTISLLGPVTGTVAELALGVQKGWSIFASAARGIGKVLGKGGPLGMIFGGLEELFTGELTSALDLGDGLGARLLGAVTGAFNGFFTGFTRLIDDGINWVMEGLGISFRSNLTTWVDIATLSVVSSIKLLGLGFMNAFRVMKIGIQDVIAELLLKIPGVSEDAPWIKSIRESQKESYALIQNGEEERDKILKHYSETRAELEKEDANGKMKTLRDIGAEQVKAQKETADKVKGLTKTTQDNVIYGVNNVMGAVRSTASQLTSPTTQAATPSSQPATTVASLQPTKQPQVNQPEVNRTQVDKDKKRDQQTQSSELTVVGMTELIANAQAQLDVLKQLLANNVLKQSNDEMTADRPAFSDAALLNNSILSA